MGALFLLRNARAAHPLHDEIPAASRARRQRDRARHAQARARGRVRSARRAAVLVADLRTLYRARVPHADLRRLARRPPARPAPHCAPGRGVDGDRPFHDGVRAPVPVCAHGADPGQWRIQAEHVGTGRRPLRAGRPPARPRLFDLLCRHQSGRGDRAARVRHAQRRLRLALRVCRRRRRNDARAGDLPVRAAVAAGRSAAQGGRDGQREEAAHARRVAQHPGAHRVVRADELLLGDLRAAGQHHRAMGRHLYRPLCRPPVLARRDPHRLVPVLQPAHDPRIHALPRRALGLARAARQRAFDRHQDVDRLLRRCGREPDHARGRLAVGGWPRRELALAPRLFRGYHDRRALHLADRIVARVQACARTHGIDADGGVARHQLYREPDRRLARQLLEHYGQDDVLPDDRRHRHDRRRRDPCLRSAALAGDQGLSKSSIKQEFRVTP